MKKCFIKVGVCFFLLTDYHIFLKLSFPASEIWINYRRSNPHLLQSNKKCLNFGSLTEAYD